MNILRTKQDIAIQSIPLEMKILAKEEAEGTLRVLQDTRMSHIMRLKYYAALTGDSSVDVPDAKSEWNDVRQAIESPTKDDLRMSPLELEMRFYDEASNLGQLAAAIEGTCSSLAALPRVSTQMEPMGIGASLQFDASNISTGMMFDASVLKQAEQAKSDTAGRHSRNAQLVRQR